MATAKPVRPMVTPPARPEKARAREERFNSSRALRDTPSKISWTLRREESRATGCGCLGTPIGCRFSGGLWPFFLKTPPSKPRSLSGRGAGRFGRLVQHQPVQPQLLRSFHELHEVHRLADIAVGSQLVTGDHVSLFIRGSEHHYRNQFGTGILPQPAQHLQSVYLGQFEVEQDQLRRGNGPPP